MTNYPYSQYGTNPNGGRNANAENGWGPYKWPGGVPIEMLGIAVFGDVRLQVRRELVELVMVLLKITETKYNYNLYGPNEKPPAGWCWGYSNRPIAGTTTASNHSKGRAVDLNAPNNPYTSPLVCDIAPAIVNTWERAGFYWGGRYSGKKDAMHFEYCWTPQDVKRHLAYAYGELGGIILPPKQEDWLEMVSESQWNALVQQVSDIQMRIRGVDTKPGERHEFVDMLQSIDGSTADTYTRVRGADTGPGQKHEFYDMLQGIDKQTENE